MAPVAGIGPATKGLEAFVFPLHQTGTEPLYRTGHAPGYITGDWTLVQSFERIPRLELGTTVWKTVVLPLHHTRIRATEAWEGSFRSSAFEHNALSR